MTEYSTKSAASVCSSRPGARAVIIEKRKKRFNDEYLLPMLREARLLGISRDELEAMLDELWQK